MPSTLSTMLLHTRGGTHQLTVRVAASFFVRLIGLMFSRPLPADHALLLTCCNSVHTGFMRYPIDVVYLSREGIVTRCISGLVPWRMTAAGRAATAGTRTVHTLELPAGSLDRYALAPGDRLEWMAETVDIPRALAAVPRRQQGAALVEFAVVGPLLTLIGMALLQYGMLFFAKNQHNHAAFMAARAGSMRNADLGKVRQAYAQALIPAYGGGRNVQELAESYAKALADVSAHTRIELLNPSKQSFDDWNDQGLQQSLGKGKRVIPNGGLANKSAGDIRANSGQNIHDANLIKLRITHGYEPKVPLIGPVYARYLRWLDDGKDPFYTAQVAAGRIPLVTGVTLQMQSDAIEPNSPVSLPGDGNGTQSNGTGTSTDTSSKQPPKCLTVGCTVESGDSTSTQPSGNGDGTGTVNGSGCQSVTSNSVQSDILFGFDSATLSDAGKQELDKELAQIQNEDLSQVTSLSVIGYTDQLGSDAYNQDLSLRRAEAVRDYLQSKGVSIPIDVEGRGASDPQVQLSQCPASGQAQRDCLAPNRRVVFVPNKKVS